MTFYFYDLETSGVNPKTARVMQFAGQRTDMDLKPIGEPDNILVKLTDDILPDPDAILVTGITPQKTIAEGVTEAEFLQQFHNEIATENTIFVGFNTVRFDDEFMRYMNYRNFYDPYEWQWKDGRSRWDLLDVVRMTRALRPDGIEWPFDTNGKPTNRLELLSSVNNLQHENAHDALSDVYATIEVAKLIKSKQPKLFQFLLEMRDKRRVQELVETSDLFIYSSGKYASEQQKTTIASCIGKTKDGAALVYNLHINPAPFLKMSVEDIITAWQRRYDDPQPKLPVKALKYNRCPAVAPISVLDMDSQKRLKLDPKKAKEYRDLIYASDFADKCLKALEKMNKARDVAQSSLLADHNNPDERLYESFIGGTDKTAMRRVRASDSKTITEITPTEFHDERLQALLPLYKARTFPESLTDDERVAWESHKKQALFHGGQKSRAAVYFSRLAALSESATSPQRQYLLEELQLYAESILPEPE